MAKPTLANRSCLARNMREGDVFDGEAVTQIRFTEGGNVSFKLASGDWRRRPSEERVKVQRVVE